MGTNDKPSNPRMQNPDGMYASEARAEDFFSLRDHYAGLAMQYFVNANNGNFCENDAEQIFYIADTMLKVRKKQST